MGLVPIVELKGYRTPQHILMLLACSIVNEITYAFMIFSLRLAIRFSFQDLWLARFLDFFFLSYNNSGQHLGEMAQNFHWHSLCLPCVGNFSQYLSFSAFLWFYIYSTNLCGVKEPLVIALLYPSFKIAQPFEPLAIFAFHFISVYYIILFSVKFEILPPSNYSSMFSRFPPYAQRPYP
jgi:hypothetical protein